MRYGKGIGSEWNGLHAHFNHRSSVTSQTPRNQSSTFPIVTQLVSPLCYSAAPHKAYA